METSLIIARELKWVDIKEFSRKISPVQQLTDVMSPLLERSDPEIACSICEEKHKTTTHENAMRCVNIYDNIDSTLIL